MISIFLRNVSTLLNISVRRRRLLSIPSTIQRHHQIHLFSSSEIAAATTKPTVDGRSGEEWRKHPNLRKTLKLPTLIVPSNQCQRILTSSTLKKYLCNIEHIYPRIRLVQSYNKTHQLILCNNNNNKEELKKELYYSSEALELLQSLDVELNGPTFEISLDYTNWTVAYIFQQVLPSEVHPSPTSYEQIGHVAHLNLRAIHLPHRKLIGDVLLNTLPNIETVINKVGEVSGDYRTYEMEVLAGHKETRVNLQENGVKLQFDVKDVYWCSRLSGEREYMVKHVFQANQTIADVFCGIGAQLLQAAKKLNCRIIANDWNPNAVASCKANVALNHLQKNFHKVSCQDAFDFLVDVGLVPPLREEDLTMDASTTTTNSLLLPDHILMNFPLEAPKFLSALRWWSASSITQKLAREKSTYPVFHVYTFAWADDRRSVKDMAIDVIADNLIPLGGAAETSYQRKEELDRLGCKVQARIIRDVAPGKVVVCVSFRLTRRLVKHIQGDFL